MLPQVQKISSLIGCLFWIIFAHEGLASASEACVSPEYNMLSRKGLLQCTFTSITRGLFTEMQVSFTSEVLLIGTSALKNL